MLIFDNVSKSFHGKNVLVNARLSLDTGSVLLVGPNGSGKSTFIKLGAGLLPPDSGQVICHYPCLYIPEAHPRRSSFTSRSLCRFIGECNEDLLEDYANKLNVDGLLDRRFRSVSMGEARKLFIVAILGSVSRDANCMFIDEPFANLDAYSIERVLEVIMDSYRSNRASVLVVSSHIINRRLVPFFNYVATIYSGRLYIVSVKELLRSLRDTCLKRTDRETACSQKATSVVVGGTCYWLAGCEEADFTREDILSDTFLLHIYVASIGGELY